MGGAFKDTGLAVCSICDIPQQGDFAQKHTLQRREYKLLFKLAECWHSLDEKEFREMYAEYVSSEKATKGQGWRFF